MDLDNMKKLANLARIEINDKEMMKISESFDSILSYVGQIKSVSVDTDIQKQNINIPKNITREDIVTNKKGEYTEKIINQMPAKEGGYLKVKQIL